MEREDSVLITPARAAQLMGISRSKCYSLIAEGRLPVIRIGASVRVNKAALLAQIERETTQPTAA